MDGSSIITHGSAVLGNPGASWQLRATGDFYGDGISDLVLQNTNGALAIWGISQGASGPTLNMAQTVTLPENPGPAWQLEGTGDVNGDGKSDLVFQNTGNGEVAVWEMSGASLLGSAVVDLPGTDWKVKSIGDYSGNGLSDILMQNSSTGALEMLFMNGLTVSSTEVLSTNPGTSWVPVKSA